MRKTLCRPVRDLAGNKTFGLFWVPYDGDEGDLTELDFDGNGMLAVTLDPEPGHCSCDDMCDIQQHLACHCGITHG